MKVHSFDVKDAEKYGVNKAIILQHLKFHMESNKNVECFHYEGKVWCYARLKSLEDMYPYFTGSSISRWLKELEEDGVIEMTRELDAEAAGVGHHTKFYHVIGFFSQNGNSSSQNESSSSQNGNSHYSNNYNNINPPIVPPQKKDEICESIYQEYPRKVKKRNALKAIGQAVDRVSETIEDDDLDDKPKWIRAARWIFGRTQKFASSPQGNNSDRGYIPHPATWFNGEQYYDEDEEWEIVHKKENVRGGDDTPEHYEPKDYYTD